METMTRIAYAALLAGGVSAGMSTAGQDVDKARGLLRQAPTALAVPAPPAGVVLDTPAALDAALAAAAPGAVLTLSRTLVYPTALTLARAVTLQADGLTALTRMDTTTPLPSFRDGITIRGDQVTLIGLEVRKGNPLTDIVTFTGASVTLDRLRILGDPLKGAKRGIAANGNGDAVIVRSYVDDCFQTYPGNDSQAIIAWDMAPGLRIEDNFLRAGSETVMIGGADSSTAARTPTNIVIRGNTITKRPEWQAMAIGVKNALELKNATHVLVENNDISYSWGGHGQDGYLLLMTVRNQDGRAPWSTVQDVVVRGNRFSHAAGAINLLGLDNIKETSASKPTPLGTVRPSVRMARIAITGNTFTDLDPTTYAGSNRMILIGSGPTQVTIDQNTFAGAHIGSQVYFYGTPPAEGFRVTNNTWPPSTYGIKGDGVASGGATWAAFVSGGTLAGNVEK
ncbi:MAG: hypothetical protein JWL71_693 [Acidobacteria bacterium]|nr:hypothetical protein [Acidobacteriota bacterium]